MKKSDTEAVEDILGRRYAARVFVNHKAAGRGPYGPKQWELLNRRAFEQARRVVCSWPKYAPTPLVQLPGLANRMGIAMLWCKHEGSRFGVGSFKPLGMINGMCHLLVTQIFGRKAATEVSAIELIDGTYCDLLQHMTVSAASSGNQGRALAWIASNIGCDCVIYMTENVSDGHEAAILAYGAKVVRVSGTYSDAVDRADKDSARFGHILINERSHWRYPALLRDIVQGYAIVADEIMARLPERERLTHVFVPGGGGDFATAICGHLWENCGDRGPRLVIVEPEAADCLYQSAIHGKPTPANGDLVSLMDGLAVAEISPVAWPILGSGAYGFMCAPDSAAADGMRLMSIGTEGDRPLVVGATGAGAFAGLLVARSNEQSQQSLCLDADSRVLFIATEDATDSQLYHELVGSTPKAIIEAGDRPTQSERQML